MSVKRDLNVERLKTMHGRSQPARQKKSLLFTCSPAQQIQSVNEDSGYD